MFSAFCMGQVASGPGLISIVLFRVTESLVRKLGCPGTAKIYQLKAKKPSYRYILENFSIF